LVRGEFDKLGQFFDGDKYIQHNVTIVDAVSWLGKAIE